MKTPSGAGLRRALSVLLASLVVVLVAAAPASALKPRKTPSQFVVKIDTKGGACNIYPGISFAPVPGAISYAITYYDGYYKHDVTTFMSKADTATSELSSASAPFRSVAGLFGQGPCGPDAGDPTYGGRFTKKPTVVATFAPDYKPKASLHLSVSTPDGGASIGDTVAVKVTATGGDVPLHNVSLSTLRAPGDLADVVKQASGRSGFALKTGGSKSFTFSVKALKPGAAALSITGTGSSKHGKVSDKAGGTLRIARAQLAVTVGADTPTVPLEVNADGTVEPSDLGVTVRFTNTGDTAIENVSLQSLNPVPVRDGQKLDQLAFPSGTLPAPIGDVKPHESVAKHFTLTVTGDGRYRFRALALYAGANGSNGKETALGGAFEATVKPLYFAPKINPDGVTTSNGVPVVTAGKTWYIDGKLKNESSYRTLCVNTIVPAFVGNAAGTGPVDLVESNTRDPYGAFAGEVKPGQDFQLRMFVDTSTAGSTRGQVTFAPQVAYVDPGEDCTDDAFKHLSKVAPTGIATGVEGLDFPVTVDTSVPFVAPAPGSAILGFGAGVAKVLVYDTIKETADFLVLAHDGWKAESEYLQKTALYPPPLAIAQSFALFTAQKVAVATDVYATYWKVASADMKGRIVDSTLEALRRTSRDFLTLSRGAVLDAAQPFTDRIEKAYADGDEYEVTKLYGEGSTNVVKQLVLAVFQDKLAKAIETQSAAFEARVAARDAEWSEGKAASAVKEESAGAADAARGDTPPGTELTLAEKESIWRIDEASDTAFARISKKFKALIGVRSRGAGTLEELAEGSVLKHENLKPKNVSPEDVEYLGFRRQDLDQVRFRTYTDEQVAAITNRIREAPSLTAEQKVALLDRFETRLHESQYVDKIKEFGRRGEIDVGFNYRDNGIKKASTRNARRFSLESEAATATGDIPAGGEYFTPLQENLSLRRLRKNGVLPKNCRRKLSSVLCTVTGDIDGVYITRVNGTNFTTAEMVAIYKELQEAGWQHPETLTWISKDGFLFAAKQNILKELEVGGKAMVEYAPDGITRATYLNLNDSKLLSTGDYRLHIVGGYSDTLR